MAEPLRRDFVDPVFPTMRCEVHKDEIAGQAKKVRGALKDVLGKVTGDDKLRVDGALDKAEGGMQKNAGKAKESVRDALKL
jgi:uncharacterized protein YjbJ (UPF0337 family)